MGKSTYARDYASVYCLVTSDGRYYVGSTSKTRWRKSNHFSRLRHGRHWVRALQALWNQFGEAAVEFRILERVSPDRLLEREQYWMDALKSEYNTCKIAGSPRGRTLSDATRFKIAQSRAGKRLSAESIRKRTETARKNGTLGQKPGWSPSQAYRDRMSIATQGSKNGFARLSEDDIRDIKLRIRNGESQTSIAAFYGVAQAHISRIALGKAWKHIA